MNDVITPEENQRIAGEFSRFQAEHPEFIFTQRNVSLIGEELERLAQVELQSGKDFTITAATLETAAANLIAAGKIEIASVQRNNTEAETPAKTIEPFMAEERDRLPSEWTAYWEDKRKTAEDANFAARRKVAENIFGRTTQVNREEKPQRIPDSLMDADPAEESRVLQLYDAPEIRRYLERKSFLRAGR